MLRANNEVMRLLFASYTFATEVVMLLKWGKNEVFAQNNFAKNQQKKLRRSEYPTLGGQFFGRIVAELLRSSENNRGDSYLVQAVGAARGNPY
jgi:hypothetical protein